MLRKFWLFSIHFSLRPRLSSSKVRLLTCQIDAAINPGSSGGPVIKEDKIVGEPSENRREVVVLATALADELNVGYQDLEDIVIVEANGKKLATVGDLVRAVEDNVGEYHVFVDSKGKKIVLDRKKTDERGKLILDKYKVGEDRSGDLDGNK